MGLNSKYMVAFAGMFATMMPMIGHAEEAAPANKTAPAAPEQTAPQTNTPPSANTSAPAAPSVLAQRFEDWTYRCVVPVGANAPSSCEVAQSVKVDQDGRTIDILNVAVSRANDKSGMVAWALLALTPLDVDLPSDFGLAITGDKNKPVVTRYRNCNQMGCFVVVPLAKDLLQHFRRGQEGAGFFRLLNGKTVKVVFSLKGFDAAFDKLSAKTPPLPVGSTKAAPVAAPTQQK